MFGWKLFVHFFSKHMDTFILDTWHICFNFKKYSYPHYFFQTNNYPHVLFHSHFPFNHVQVKFSEKFSPFIVMNSINIIVNNCATLTLGGKTSFPWVGSFLFLFSKKKKTKMSFFLFFYYINSNINFTHLEWDSNSKYLLNSSSALILIFIFKILTW